MKASFYVFKVKNFNVTYTLNYLRIEFQQPLRKFLLNKSFQISQTNVQLVFTLYNEANKNIILSFYYIFH